jgi:hypothetical protein
MAWAVNSRGEAHRAVAGVRIETKALETADDLKWEKKF